jgi:hypothetical protein
MGFNNGVGSINPFSLNKEVTYYTIPGTRDCRAVPQLNLGH